MSAGQNLSALIKARRRILPLWRFVLFAGGAAALSGCASQKHLPSKDEDGALSVSAANANRQSANSYTMAQRRLLDIVELQDDLFSDPNIDGLGEKSHAQLLTKASRIDSLWRSYILDFPEDVQALVIYAKFLRRTGRENAAYEMFKRADALDPKLAVVKQQLSAMDAEAGEIANALSRIKAALEIEPENPAYLRQCAYLLAGAKRKILEEELLSPAQFDALLLRCHKIPHKNNPADRQLKIRYAQSFYDMCAPDYTEALELWRQIFDSAALNIEKQTAAANIARVLVELNRDAEALEYLKLVDIPALERPKRLLLNEIQRAKKPAQKDPKQTTRTGK